MATSPLIIDVLLRGLGGVNQLQSSLNRLDKQGLSLQNTFRLVKTALVALGGAQIIKQSIELQKTFDRLQQSLNGLAGSTLEGGEAFKKATQFSTQYGFELDKTLKATQTLLQNNIPLREIPKYYEMIGAAARMTGTDIDAAAEDFVKIKDAGLEGSKILGQAFRARFPQMYEQVKNSASLSAKAMYDFLGPQGKGLAALEQGSTGMSASLARVTQSFDKFIIAFTGGDNKEKMEDLAKAIGFVTENLEKFEIALGLIAITFFGPAGILVGLGLLAKGLYDALPKLKAFNDEMKRSTGEGIWGEGDMTDTDAINGKLGQTKQIIKDIGQEAEKTKKIIEEYDFAVDYSLQNDVLSHQEQILGGIGDGWKKITEANKPATLAAQATVEVYNAISNAATNALLSIITKAKTAKQAMQDLARVIVNEIFTALIKLYVVQPLFALMVEWINKTISSWQAEKNAIDRTNSSLQKQIGLRTILMLLGFAGGGKIGFGGGDITATEGSFANGGKIGFKGFRAGGGGVASGAYIVGERGAELFVPNSAGTIIPNNRLGSEMGTTNINFNISTVDSAGFDELLLSRKSLIVGTIQQAFRQQGRRLA